MYNIEWKEYYVYLRKLQKKGYNLFGCTPVLQNEYDLQKRNARTIVSSYMINYDDLVKDGVIDE